MATGILYSFDVGNVVLAITVVAVLGGFLFLRTAYGAPIHPQEPPVLKPWIPIVGHIIGMVTEGTLYFRKIGYAFPRPRDKRMLKE